MYWKGSDFETLSLGHGGIFGKLNDGPPWRLHTTHRDSTHLTSARPCGIQYS